MSDISVTESAVKAANSNTVKATGTAGEAIPIGKSVYADPATGKIYKAQATNPTHTANLVGTSLTNAAGDGQPLLYATHGDVPSKHVLCTGDASFVSPSS